MIDYKNIKQEKPPLDVKIIIKKSKFKIHNGAKIAVLESNLADLDWHVDWYFDEGYDLWAVV